jgi:hypothetical protein
MDKKFNDVRDFIYDNPGASIDEVCEATGAETAEIRRWLTEGRLILAKGSPISLRCDKCGAPIVTGKQCENCLNKLRSTLQGAADTLKPAEAKQPLDFKKDGRMHVGVRKK